MIFAVLGLSILVLGGFRVVRSVRTASQERPRWLVRAAQVAVAAAWFGAGSVLVLLGLRAPTVLLGAFLAVLVLGAVADVAARAAMRRTAAAGEDRLWPVVRVGVLDAWARTRSALRRAYLNVAPDGWGEVRLGLGAVERLVSPGLFIRGYFGALLVMPVVIALSVALSLSTLPDPERRVISVLVGFNALAVLSVATTVAVLTLVIVTVLRWAELLLAPVDLRAAMRIVVASTGCGTAIGVIAAALLPVFVWIFPGSATAGLGEGSALTPQVLLDLPAVGAVLGYGFGVGAGLVEVLRGARNLVIRRLMAPSLFFATLILFGTWGLTPRALLSALIPPGEVDCAVDPSTLLLDSPGSILRVGSVCGSGQVFLDDAVLLWIVGVVLVVIATSFLMADVRSLADNRPGAASDSVPPPPRETAAEHAPAHDPESGARGEGSASGPGEG